MSKESKEIVAEILADKERYLELKYAEVPDGTSLFLAGTNLGSKFDPRKRQGLFLRWDIKFDHLIVIWGDEAARQKHYKSITEGKVATVRIVEGISSPMIAGISKAQIHTPTTHVQNGPGHGKTKQ